MAFKTNPWLEECMKKHSKAFFAIGILISTLLVLIGIGLLIIDLDDIFVPIFMLIAGVLGTFSTIFLKHIN